MYRKFEVPLVAAGWDVIVFVPSEEEDSDRITCGNALSYLRVRVLDDNEGFSTQYIVEIKHCPLCGRAMKGYLVMI